MSRPRQHRSLDCQGTIQTVYVRRGAEGKQVALGTVCTGCDTFVSENLDDGTPEELLSRLRANIEAIAGDVSALLHQVAVYERFAEIVRGNPELLENYNPFLDYFRRWYATALSLGLRRHAEADTRALSLRSFLGDLEEGAETLTVDRVADLFGGQQAMMFPRESWNQISDSKNVVMSKERIGEDAALLERMARRVKRHANLFILGAEFGASEAPMTFDELGSGVRSIGEITRKYLLLFTGSNTQLSPVDQTDWTDIFQRPWLDNVRAPYRPGDPGVPYDAQPYMRQLENVKPVISMRIQLRDREITLELKNIGLGTARRVKLFVPLLGPYSLAEPIEPGQIIALDLATPGDPSGVGVQYVIEFDDVHGYLYRQYANLLGGWSASETTIPYLVARRIVGQGGRVQQVSTAPTTR